MSAWSVVHDLLDDIGPLMTGVAAVSGAAATWYSRHAKRSAAEVNDAVNHTHDPDHPRIYDIAQQNAQSISFLVGEMAELRQHNNEVHSQIVKQLMDHVEWEEGSKYPELESEVRRLRELHSPWADPGEDSPEV